MTPADAVTSRQRERLNAPPGYRWTDTEVIYEKNQSFLAGMVAGVIWAFFLCLVLLAIL